MSYYSVFEGEPFEGKGKLAEQFYNSLVPHLHKITGFHEDGGGGSPDGKRGLNIAIWDDADAVRRWRNEDNHLRIQSKGAETVYQGYRLRLGPEINGQSESGDSKTRQYMTLFYRSNVDGTPSDDVTEWLDESTRSKLRESMIDSVVYQGPQTVWITGWRTKDAIADFERSVKQSPDDKLIRLRIERDYTKSDRNDAPNETPGVV